jgi:hypothetical protein
MRICLAVAMMLAVSLCACDPFESHEYRISHSARGDATKVQRILREVAIQTGIPKSAPTPYDSPTIALYRSPNVQLRASISGSDVRVVLMRYNWPAPKAFIRADRFARVDFFFSL